VETRTLDQIRAHYEVERELADRLRQAPAHERLRLYSEVYDALFERVPDHPQLSKAVHKAVRTREVAAELGFLDRFLTPNIVFLELGAGDCALAMKVVPSVKMTYALDVSDVITAAARECGGIHVVLSDGVSVDVPPGTIDVAYSNQLMEHLHPDDARVQLTNIWRSLAPGGRYVCVTPNRLSGPHDVSQYFDSVATGFHLKEYTVIELSRLMKDVGFSSVASYVSGRDRTLKLPVPVISSLEAVLQRFPNRAQKALASRPPLRWALGIRIVATK
jgi:SAM-dependent methyltransferase